MKIIKSKNKLKKLIQNEKKIGFVPTMGALHEGHDSLIKKSKSECKKTLVSIFINKPQFNNKNDYKKYPRFLKKDIIRIKKFKVDYLFLPLTGEIYSFKRKKKIIISSFNKKLCGKFRPGHFNAVVDVIDRFIQIINPSRIYLGEKDMQQFKIIQNYVYKKYKSIKIVLCKTIRESNGLALSSRNQLLSKKERNVGSNIYKLIKKNKNKIVKKQIPLKVIKLKILKLGANRIDYIEILNVNRVTKPYLKKKNQKIFFSYYLGKTRLIDNI